MRSPLTDLHEVAVLAAADVRAAAPALLDEWLDLFVSSWVHACVLVPVVLLSCSLLPA